MFLDSDIKAIVLSITEHLTLVQKWIQVIFSVA